MTEQEYTERNELIDNNNELIAIYEGWELIEREGIQCFIKYGYRLYHYELRYNTDWAKLIPIWQKFRDLRFEGVHEQFEHSEFKQNIAHRICYGTIETAYQSIVSGIQWYNSIK